MAKSPTPALAPFLRSDTVGNILAELYAWPDEERTLSELASHTGVGITTVQREVERLVSAGVIADRRVGMNRLVRVNPWYPLNSPLRELVLAIYGPEPILRKLVGGIPGVELAFIYGSWAARRQGQSGTFPRDIDLLLVGDVPIDGIVEAQLEARAQLGKEVNIHRISRSEFNNPEGGFLTTLLKNQMISLIGEVDSVAP